MVPLQAASLAGTEHAWSWANPAPACVACKQVALSYGYLSMAADVL
jgi:hypothetical protein